MERGADISIRGPNNYTVMHAAASSDASNAGELIKLLAQRDPSLVEALDVDDWTPLHFGMWGSVRPKLLSLFVQSD